MDPYLGLPGWYREGEGAVLLTLRRASALGSDLESRHLELGGEDELEDAAALTGAHHHLIDGHEPMPLELEVHL